MLFSCEFVKFLGSSFLRNTSRSWLLAEWLGSLFTKKEKISFGLTRPMAFLWCHTVIRKRFDANLNPDQETKKERSFIMFDDGLQE